MIIKNKVLAYIFRTKNEVRELLVFDHRDFPDVNPQVPAGTVESEEGFEQAVIREIYEESGLSLVRPSFYLGCFDYFREDLNQLHKRHVYAFEIQNLKDEWQHIVSHGDEDKGLVFDYYWLPIGKAREKLVGKMGDYLPWYFFTEINKSHLPLLSKWLKRPHVKEFWNDSDRLEDLYEKYIEKKSSENGRSFLISYQDKVIGYIQFYWASRCGDGWWEGYAENVVGIDQYIGEYDFVGVGHGTKLITEFCHYLKKNFDISKIIVDPSPSNLRAIRCYEKAGFRNMGEIETPDGRAVLMVKKVP